MHKLLNLNFKIVDSHQRLKLACEQALKEPFVMLDTEFIRRRTFYPQLGLIQMYDGKQISLIDPLAITDFTPFIDLLKNPLVLKVLHSCTEDLEVFKHQFDQLPRPMVDTQVMAQFLGLGSSIGLSNLIKHCFGFSIEKETTCTNWLARPLSEQQLQYASADVFYLFPSYEKLLFDLSSTPWFGAVFEECDYLLSKQEKPKNLANLYKHMPNVHRLKGLALLRLQKLTQWRYLEAEKRDLAVNFVVKAENLVNLAKHGANNTFDLLQLGFNENEVRIHGKKLLQILTSCNKVEPQNYPQPTNLSNLPNFKEISKQLQTILNQLTPADLDKETLSSKKLCEEFLNWYLVNNQNPKQPPRLLQGWRKKYGDMALAKLNNYLLN